MDLIPRSIARVGTLHPRQAISVPNSSDARVAVGDDGTEWVHKELMGVNQVLAEAVSFLLANRLDLPVPSGGVSRDSSGSPSWLSHLIHAPSHWQPSLFESIEDGPESMGTMYALDALVLNEDRHDGNVLLEHRGEGTRRPWYIDFANAHIGSPVGLLDDRDLVPDPRASHFRPAPLGDAVVRAATAAAHRAQALPTECLAADAHEACDAAACPDLENELLMVLRYRCSELGSILPQYLKALEACR
ncbi:hypothetical protein [Enhygromyxa salina]|uniref:PI3K/PI4K catalytic domain-containing protein n=1 Tax=Enhygromyxa salina TaxID=215803 RepID=A0A2S9YTP2_9BACT|nr:hypothetical protein [Enhygromyxa salina]PRQ08402.1 hypothetical protein ENSA7_20290 [Enhygromyxa salina]